MKAQIYDSSGKKKAEMTLPALFGRPVREDIVAKYVESSRTWQPHSLDPRAGRRSSASGILKHRRHAWKGQYGKGISRVPRKIIWRRGTQFNWVGAEVSGTRGGRRVHGHKLLRRPRKINLKEIKIAFASALAATAMNKYIEKRYSTIKSGLELPLIVERFDLKGKNAIELLKKITGNAFPIVLKHRSVRAGKGKGRGRTYKSNAGLLIITGNGERLDVPGVEIKSLSSVEIGDLYPLGRLTLYTEKAIQELGEETWT